jgi:Xaa-Pro aminopeptidase
MDINTRIKKLRKELEKHNFDAYVIPSTDPHQSEYVADLWKGREWISGFTGSQGTVVITKDHAGLWTDSRYFIQAESELASSEMVLHKVVEQGAPDFVSWIKNELDEGSVVGCDGFNFSIGQIRRYNRTLSPKKITINYDEDLIDAIWDDRGEIPTNPIFELDISLAGKSRTEKLSEIRAEMKAQGADYHLVTTLDDIAWIYNIRSNDVTYNPVAIAYAIITQNHSTLFTDEKKIPADLMASLANDNISVKPYDAIEDQLNNVEDNEKILIDRYACSMKLYDCINPDCVIPGTTISRHLKAIKNETEIFHVKNAMIKDGVALTRLYMWLENQLQSTTVTEAELADKLTAFRKEQEGYFGESFSAIVGYQGNGAIIHYKPEHGTSASIKPEGVLLLDSGGQYTNGTTDTTRTTALGEVSDEIITNYTLVLKGHIALARAHFPKGTKGIQMDMLARQFLWQEGLNYLHGTGHGVGFFLNVHEPPQRFTNVISSAGRTSIDEGMLTSNEPGYYKENHYGIRIENLVLTVKADEKGDFLKFDTITLFPIETKMIKVSLLTEAEKKWLNNYHAEVLAKLSPFLDEDEKAWMAKNCQAI